MASDTELIHLLDHPVDLKKLVDKLFFDLDDLERAALMQPKLYLETGRFRAQYALRLATAKRRLSTTVGNKSLKIRRSSEGKITEGEIKHTLAVDSKVQRLQKRLDTLEVYEEFAKQLSEAYKERLMVLTVLAKIRASEIGAELRSVMGEEVMDKIRKKANKVRQRFAELRNEDDE